MLPILRTISVGGVLLAITITALALSPPGASHLQFTSADAPARGALIDRSKHPEWRQFLMFAALRRVEELDRLRNLPDTPARLPEIPIVAPLYTPPEFPADATKNASKVLPKTAGLPSPRTEVGPSDETGSFNAAPSATIPIDIGEPSSTELPIAPVDDKPPVITVPLTAAPETAEPLAAKISAIDATDRIKPLQAPRKTAVLRRHPKAPAPAKPPAQTSAPIPFNFLAAFFESLLGKQLATVADKRPAKLTVKHTRRIKLARPPVIHSVSQ